MALADYDDISKVLVQPGRLIKNPTNLSADFPYGGTSLGLTESGVLLSRGENFEILTNEENGQTPIKVIHKGESLAIQVELIEWDDAVFDLAWQGYTTTGGTSGLKNVTWPGDGTMYPGKDLAQNAFTLMFAPEDTTNNKVMVARKVVSVSPPQEIKFATSEKSILVVRFIVLVDTSIGAADARYNYRGLFIGDIRDVQL